MKNKYTIEIFFSDEDEGYIAVTPELPGCSTFGATEEEALDEIKIAIELWIEAARKDGREVPQPNSKPLISGLTEEAWDTIDGTIAHKRLNDESDRIVTVDEARRTLGI